MSEFNGRGFRELPNDGEEERKITTALYIMRPNYLDKYEAGKDKVKVGDEQVDVHNCFRCGSVGTKAYQYKDKDADAKWKHVPGNLYGRMMMYESNWLTGGRVYAVLKLIDKDTQRIHLKRQAKNEKGQSFVTYMEKAFHEELRRQGEMSSKYGGKARAIRRLARTVKEGTNGQQVYESEWFYGDFHMMLKALESVSVDQHGVSTGQIRLYKKTGNVIKGRTVLASEYTLRTTKGVKTFVEADDRAQLGATTRAMTRHKKGS